MSVGIQSSQAAGYLKSVIQMGICFQLPMILACWNSTNNFLLINVFGIQFFGTILGSRMVHYSFKEFLYVDSGSYYKAFCVPFGRPWWCYNLHCDWKSVYRKETWLFILVISQVIICLVIESLCTARRRGYSYLWFLKIEIRSNNFATKKHAQTCSVLA